MSNQRDSDQQQQERISRGQCKTYLEKHEWITADVEPDMGEDFLVRIYEKQASTGISLYLQLKSVQSIDRQRLASGPISYGFEVKDLIHWEAQAIPVFIIVWDINQEKGWWIFIKDAIKYLNENSPDWKQKKEVNVHIPYENALDDSGLRYIRFIAADFLYPTIASGKEFNITAKFEFPPSPEGQAKYAEVERYIKAGEEVEIDGQFIADFQMPDWWQRLYGSENLKAKSVKMGPIRTPIVTPAQLDFYSPGSQTERIPYIELRNIKDGQEEATFNNDHQNIPMKLSLLINKVSGKNEIHFSLGFANADALVALQAVRILRILAEGCSVRLMFIKNGYIQEIPIQKGVYQPPDPSIVIFVENIVFIQEHLGKQIIFSEDGVFTNIDEMAAIELVSMFRTGKFYSSLPGITLELKKPAILMLTDAIKSGELVRFRITSNDSYVELLHQRIELGPIVQYFAGKWAEPVDKVMEFLNSASDEDSYIIRLRDVELIEEIGSP
jgi:hypothetical protein